MVAAVGRYRNDALSCATSRLRSAAARIEWEGQHTNLLLQNLSAIYVHLCMARDFMAGGRS